MAARNKGEVIMKLLPIALLLTSCATLSPETQAELKLEVIVSANITAEVAVREHCPRTTLETAVLLASRLAFDAAVGSGLPEAHQRRISEARDETNRVCGIQ